MSTSPVPMETLLTHRDWVRRLARSLVLDDSAADDALRERLARDAGGGSDWMTALIPLTGLRPETAAGATTAATAKAAAIYGGTVMGTKTAVALGVGVAIAAAYVGGTMVGGGGSTSDEDVEALRARIESLETTRARPADRQAAPTTDRKTAGLEERAAEQSARLAAVETQLANVTRELAAANAAAAERAAATTPTPVRDPTAEQQRLRALTDDELFRAIRDMVGVKSVDRNKTIDGRAVVDACAVLLARSLDAAKRAEALTLKGIGHRVLGDRVAEEAAFREAVTAAGPQTKEGRSATYQLAWTAASRGDPRGAAESFLRLSQDPDAPPVQRAWNRYYAATHFEEAGDKDRAVAEYRGVVNEYGETDDQSTRMVVTQARGAIERIAKAATR